MKKWQSYGFFRFLSSLKLAVFSILSLATVLSVATVCESLYGMRGAHLLVYGQPWFHGLLGILALNVLCAALSRYPWKKHQTGFVITHLGILILLLGSWITMQFGVDGNLPIIEGQEDSEVILHKLQLVVSDDEIGRSQAFPIPESALKESGNLVTVQLSDTDALRVDEFLPRVRMSRQVERAPATLGAPAVRIELFNDRFSVEEWLLADKPGASEVNLGPALLSFRRLESPAEQTLFQQGKWDVPVKNRATDLGFILVRLQGREYRVGVREGQGGWRPLGSSGLEVQIDEYFPYAVVQNNRLVNRSKEPVNPTVQMRLRNGQGKEEKHTVFANFPEFATLHRQPLKEKPFGAQVRMISSESPATQQGVRGKLFLAQTADGRSLLYRITATGNRFLSQGKVELDKEVPTGWMDLKFRVVDWFAHSIQYEKASYVERLQGSENFPAAISLKRKRGTGDWEGVEQRWLVEGGSVSLPAGNRVLSATFQRDRFRLPFRLRLEKFHMGTDPGTTKAASYESDVVVRDPAGGDQSPVKISMNEPLKYGGYTFYQASYQMRGDQPPISVFSVNRDPGRWVKYGGSLVMVFGILVMFYFNPSYWGIVLGTSRKDR